MQIKVEEKPVGDIEEMVKEDVESGEEGSDKVIDAGDKVGHNVEKIFQTTRIEDNMTNRSSTSL